MNLLHPGRRRGLRLFLTNEIYKLFLKYLTIRSWLKRTISPKNLWKSHDSTPKINRGQKQIKQRRQQSPIFLPCVLYLLKFCFVTSKLVRSCARAAFSVDRIDIARYRRAIGYERSGWSGGLIPRFAALSLSTAGREEAAGVAQIDSDALPPANWRVRRDWCRTSGRHVGYEAA